MQNNSQKMVLEKSFVKRYATHDYARTSLQTRLASLVWLSREKVMSARRNILLVLQPKSVNPSAQLRHGPNHHVDDSHDYSHHVDDTHVNIREYIWKYIDVYYTDKNNMTSGSELGNAPFWLYA